MIIQHLQLTINLAYRFKLISSHGMEVEASSAPLKEKQEGQEKKGRRAVVTQLPHRPGEEAVLGLDINADRAGHSRHLADSHYFPREAADHPDRVGQPGGLHSHSHKQSRHSQQEYGEPATAAAQAPCSSPQRKEVPYRGAHVLLEYGHGQGLGREDDSEDYRRGRGRDNHQYGNRSSTTASATAAACEIGRHSHSPKAVYQPPITQKQGLFRADLVQPVPVPVRRPVTVSAGQRRPPSQPTVPTAAAAVERPAASAPEEEYRIFDERSDRRRPGTAGAPSIRDPREPPPLPDDNGLRKERLLAMWDKQQQQEGRGLGLPSMRAEDSDKPGRGPSRPKTAMSRLLGGGGAGGGGEGPGEGGYVELKRMNPPEGPTSKSKGRDLMQYQDIMYSCREISDRQRQPVHRRQKSDVTNPSYVLPPPPSSPPANGDKRGGGGHHRQQQRQQSQFQFQFGGKEVGGEGRGERRKERGGGVVGDGRKRVSMVGEVRVDVAPAPAADDDFIGEDGHALAHVVHPQGSSSGKEIRLRGTGSRANGEMLPSQQARMHKDSAYNIICGT